MYNASYIFHSFFVNYCHFLHILYCYYGLKTKKCVQYEITHTEKCLTSFCYHTKKLSHSKMEKLKKAFLLNVRCPLLNVKIQYFILEFFMW